MTSLSPRPHQAAALADLMTSFAVHDRVVLSQPPGCGKTLVARWHAEASDARRVLVLLPSLALVAQTLREWRRLRTWAFDALVVCSDPSTAAGAAERGRGDQPVCGEPDWSSIKVAVTTHAEVARDFLDRSETARPSVVFATYHSSPVIAAAQEASPTPFDLVVCDEAHRLAGAPSTAFRTVLDAQAIKARRRLFMTATPRICNGGASVISMDDVDLFGPQASSLGFEEAISSGLLCDYQVMVVSGDQGEVDDDPMVTAPAAMINAIDKAGLTRILSFHNLVGRSARFSQLLDGQVTPGGRRIACRHLDGGMPTAYRASVLAWLADPDASEVRIVSNARLLGEGIDVPAIDGVFFADPRSSVIDAIQTVGRVLRPAPGKRIGTVVVPVAVPPDGDDDTELMVSRFSALWTVLRALRAQDQRLAREIDALAQMEESELGPDRPHLHVPPRIHYLLPDGSLDSIQVRLVQEVGDAWERYFGACRQWATTHPDRRMPRGTRHNDLPIGEWAVKQRTAYAAGNLPVERTERLAGLPNWFWRLDDAEFDDTYALLATFAADHGSLTESPVAPSVFDGLYTSPPRREILGVWLAGQRQAYRAGLLDPGRAELLELLPGWTWTPVDAVDLDHIAALRQFAEAEGHADVPTDHIEAGLQLGRWAWDVRRRKLTGRLHPALEAEIWAATPSKWVKGAGRRWNWQKAGVLWRLSYTALRCYADREGHASPPSKHREELPDITVALGQWVALQRHLRRKGELDDQRADALERLPDWSWDGNVGGTKPFTEPIELPAGLEHGSAGAIARGCGCESCVLARRTKENTWRAERRAEQMAVGVPVTRVRLHLRHLESRLAEQLDDTADWRRTGKGRALIAATSGVPLGVIRQIADGTRTGLDPAHEAKLLATSVTLCLTNLTTGSRGRKTQASAQKVSAAPTWARVRDLQRRGFTLGWIGRELGYQRSLQLQPDRVTRRVAEEIRRLHDQIGDLVAPPVREVPPLSRLRRAERKVA
ncbi:MAG TPA: Helicase associated domain protein [Microlunatus sp.]